MRQSGGPRVTGRVLISALSQMMMMPMCSYGEDWERMCVCVCVFVYLIGVDEVESEDSVSKTRVKFDTSLSSVSGISSIQLPIHLHVRYQ